MSLDGSSVLVTGGTRGIGLAIALRLVRDGASRAVLGYMRNDEAAEEAAAQLRAAGAEPVLVRGEVSKEHVVAAVFCASGEHAGLVFHDHQGVPLDQQAITDLCVWVRGRANITNETCACSRSSCRDRVVYIILENSSPKSS